MSERAGSTSKIPLNFLLIGKTGHGKSATGNSILGRPEFTVSSQGRSKTKDVKVAWAEFGKYIIKVVDGPGLQDTDINQVEDKENAFKNMAEALLKCNGGVHAFILVLKHGVRWTAEEVKTVCDLKSIFGENYLKDRGIVVLSEADQFTYRMGEENTPDKTIDEWIKEQDADLGNLFKECSHRVVFFNNRAIKEEQEKQRNQLIIYAEELRKKGMYTSKHFQKYAEMRQKLIDRERFALLNEDTQRQINLLSADLQCIKQTSSIADVEHVETRIDDLQKEISGQGHSEENSQSLSSILSTMKKTTQELKKDIKEKNPANIKLRTEELRKQREQLKDVENNTWKKVLLFIGIGVLIVGAIAVAGAAVAAGGSIVVTSAAVTHLAPMGLLLLKLAFSVFAKKE